MMANQVRQCRAGEGKEGGAKQTNRKRLKVT